MGTLGFAIIGVIVINGAFSFWQERKAEQAIDALQELLPRTTRVRRGGDVMAVQVAEIVPGDVILLSAGDEVPADAMVLSAFGLAINTATITGESRSTGKSEGLGAKDESAIAFAKNVVLAGTNVVAGEASALVLATGMRTELGKIAAVAQSAYESPSPLQLEIKRVSRLVAMLSTALGVLFFVVGTAMGIPFWQNILFAVGIIVANVPEGLLPTVTLSLALASQRMAKQNALVRHLVAVETLGEATVICTDKTGTLTQNRMASRRVFSSGILLDADDEALKTNEHEALLSAALSCHNLGQNEEGGVLSFLGDPMEIALCELARKVRTNARPEERIDEIPFDADRRRLSTVHNRGETFVVYCKGALEALLPLATKHLVHGQVLPLEEASRRALVAQEEALADEGYRVLAFAYREVSAGYERASLETDLILVGLVGLEDPLRPEVPDAIDRCKRAGIRVIMVTGDHPITARAVGRKIGLITREDAEIVTGERLRKTTDDELALLLRAPEVHFARLDADQKMRIVEALKRRHEVVAVTGDGVNDAPALRCADIGVAMGQNGTDVARGAADIVLLDDNFATIVKAIEEGRAVYANLRKFITYVLTSNIPELVPYLAFALFRVPIALTVVQILAVDLGTDIVPALALGAEKPDPSVMLRPPRPRKERLLDGPLLARAYLFLGPIEALGTMVVFFLVLGAVGVTPGAPLDTQDPRLVLATSAAFLTVVVMQVVNVLVCRSESASLFSAGFFSNRLLFWAVFVELCLAALFVYTPPGQFVFGTTGVPLRFVALALPFGLLLLALEEGRKALMRWSKRA